MGSILDNEVIRLKSYITKKGIVYVVVCASCKKKSLTTDKQTARLSERGTEPWLCRKCSKGITEVPEEVKKSIWDKFKFWK